MPGPQLTEDSPAPTGEVVLSVMAEVLGSGPHLPADNFYDLGGSSLDAIRICLRVNRELALDLGPETLLDSDDITGFIAVVSAAREAR